MQPLARKQIVRSNRATLRNLISNSLSWITGFPAHPTPDKVCNSPYYTWVSLTKNGGQANTYAFYWLRAAQRIVEALKHSLDSNSDFFAILLSHFPQRIQRAIQEFCRLNPDLSDSVKETLTYRFSNGYSIRLIDLKWFENNQEFLRFLLSRKAEIEGRFDVPFCFLLSRFIEHTGGAVSEQQARWFQLICSRGASLTVTSSANGNWSPQKSASDALIDILAKSYLSKIQASPKSVLSLLDVTLPANWSGFLETAGARIETEVERRVSLTKQRYFMDHQAAPCPSAIRGVVNETKLEFTKLYVDVVNIDLGRLSKIISEVSEEQCKFWIRFLRRHRNDYAKVRRKLLFANWKLFNNAHNQEVALELQNLLGLNSEVDLVKKILSCEVDEFGFKKRFFKTNKSNRLIQSKIISILIPLLKGNAIAFTENQLSTLSSIALTDIDLETCLKLLKDLSKLGDEVFSAREIRASMHFGANEFLARTLYAKGKEDKPLRDALVDLYPIFIPNPIRLFIQNLIKNRRYQECLQVCQRLKVIHALGGTIPELAGVSNCKQWISAYPFELQEGLELLRSSTENAEFIASSILDKFVASPKGLQRLIEGHQKKINSLPHDSFERLKIFNRIQRIRHWIRSPKALTQERLSNLNRKLIDRALLERLGEFFDASHLVIQNELSTQLKGKSFAKSCQRNFEIIDSILELNGVSRKLGLKLIFEFYEEPDFASMPARENDRFLEEMESMGINVDPWVGSTAKLDVKGEGGSPYQLAFCRSVVDFLMMGDHFNTCLSLFDVNFFQRYPTRWTLINKWFMERIRAEKSLGVHCSC